MSCATVTALGAYALGALDDRERAQVDAHVAGCRECLQELESLIAVASHLARVPADEVADEPSAAAHPRFGDAPIAPPYAAVRRTRRRGLIGAALVAAVAAISVLAPLAGDQPPPGVTRAAAADARTGVRAAVEVAPRPWGTRLTVGLRGAAPGERCRLVARGRDGRSEVAASWTATYRGSADVTGAAAITAADLAALDVVTAAGRVLVHVPIGDTQ